MAAARCGGNFIAGNYALGIDWADVGIMAQDEDASIIKGKLGYFVLPGQSRVWNIRTGAWDEYDSPQAAPYLGWGGWHGSIAGNSQNPDAAWDFLNFIDSTENAFTAVTTPGTARNPYRTDHFTDPGAWETAPVAYADPAPYLAAQSEAIEPPEHPVRPANPEGGALLRSARPMGAAGLGRQHERRRRARQGGRGVGAHHGRSRGRRPEAALSGSLRGLSTRTGT